MHPIIHLASILLLCPVLAAQETSPVEAKRKPNVLFVAIDDLRPELGCYGAPRVRTPNIDRFARSAVRFDRAYCQQAICGPSRASLMTGLRPDSVGVHGNHTHFRERHPDIRTLPQWFKDHGYHSQSLGKIYHGVFPPGTSNTVADTFGDEPSWSVPTFRPGPRYYYTEAGIRAAREVYRRIYRVEDPGPDDWTQKLVFGPATEAPDVADGVLYDGQVAERAVKTLRQLAKNPKPFFLAVGFIKPHSPYIAPKKYWDLYAEDDIELAAGGSAEGVPTFARHGSGELRRYTDQPNRGEFTRAGQRRVRHSYRACTSYIDAQIGLVLDELRRLELEDDTIVVLWSDHGYHLGEAGLWGKTTNRELDTRVALLVQQPGAKGNGKGTSALVELVDLYPTLVDLAGLPVPEHLEGTSFAPVLAEPSRDWKRAAFSQFTRGKRRGYSLRDVRFRYTEWYATDDWRLIARELYDLETDPGEMHNVVDSALHRATVSRLSRVLRRGEGWRAVAASLGERQPLVKLASVFSDHMVVQRGKPIPVHGVAAPGAAIEVSFAGDERSTSAGRDGRWAVTLEPSRADREGRTLRVRAVLGEEKSELTLRDVVCGDVWLCAGQSNMRWRVEQSAEAEEVLGRADLKDLRLLDFEGALYPVGKEYALSFARALTADNYYSTSGWQRSSRKTAARFSAVAHAFGRRLVAELGVPIGLVHNAVGGVPMETYLPPDGDAVAKPVRELMSRWWTDPRFPTWCKDRARKNLARWFENPQGPRPHHPFEPSFLYRASIRPLARVPIRGVVWYQGESNATGTGSGAARDKDLNKATLVSLIRGFRRAFRDPRQPFYMVQLPGLNRNWPLFREVQFEVAQEDANTGMAISIDLGHPTDVHPRQKSPVGERLARLALAGTYGRSISPTGPMYREHRVDGRRVHISFDHAGGLRMRNGLAPLGFEVAGVDREFRPGRAKIVGESVIVDADDVASPAAVRYAFQNDPETNLVNGDGLPASPFRTDRWEISGPTVPAAGTGSFEDAKAGELRDVATDVGRFEAPAGHAEITKRFARSGSQCLRLFGGKDRIVTFTPKERGVRELSFWAERWTRRAPFEFRVSARVGGEWREVFDGDAAVRVGRGFLSHVRIPLPAGLTKIRFRSTAPRGAGVLIDDLAIGTPLPMRLVRAANARWTAPALLGRQHNPIARIDVVTAGSLTPLVLTGCKLAFGQGTRGEGTRLADIAGVRVFVTRDGPFASARPFGSSKDPSASLLFSGRETLTSGTNHLWVSVELAKDAGLEGRIAVHGVELVFGDGAKAKPTGVGLPQRIGSAVRTAGQDGCHTYRIPGLATTKAGTLIAVYDCRYRGSGDLPGDIDVGMSRSVDGGRTWEPRRVIMDMGRDEAWRYDGIGDPAVLCDRVTGTIWVAATWSHGNRSWRGSGPGLEPSDTGQWMLVRSDDDGKSWSRPVNITRQVKDPKWRFVLQGPGKGITMRDGTLVFPAQYRSADDSPFAGKPFSTLIYSKDRGETWKIGTGVKVDTTEAQIVELASGALMINCRDNRGGSRSVYTTKDLGRTWQVHETSRGALPEPVCMASLIRFEHEKLGPLLFFSNPATQRGRFNMTIQVSRDEGKTWPRRWHTLYDQRKGAGYSCLTRVDAETVGVLYEGQRELYFLRFPVRELVREK